MSVTLDPEGLERKALLEVAGNFKGKRVLEVGCGDGRLTWQYAHLTAKVIGIDPDETEIAAAIAATPPELEERVDFQAMGIEDFATAGLFDLAILSWSL